MSRPGQQHNELRYSLRSIADNLPHARVWIAGVRPRWCSEEVGHVRAKHDPTADKYTNAAAVLRAAMEADGLSDTVILMHDDMFLTAPLAGEVPLLHRGTGAEFERHLRKYYAPSSYTAAATHTHRWLERQGVPPQEVLSYSLHVPMPMHRESALESLARLPRGRYPWQLRTVYGTLARIGGEYVTRDCKVHRVTGPAAECPPPFPYPYVSTSDRSFISGTAGAWLRATYALPCRYETPER